MAKARRRIGPAWKPDRVIVSLGPHQRPCPVRSGVYFRPRIENDSDGEPHQFDLIEVGYCQEIFSFGDLDPVWPLTVWAIHELTGA